MLRTDSILRKVMVKYKEFKQLKKRFSIMLPSPSPLMRHVRISLLLFIDLFNLKLYKYLNFYEIHHLNLSFYNILGSDLIKALSGSLLNKTI